jgi:hypothetical protein
MTRDDTLSCGKKIPLAGYFFPVYILNICLWKGSRRVLRVSNLEKSVCWASVNLLKRALFIGMALLLLFGIEIA